MKPYDIVSSIDVIRLRILATFFLLSNEKIIDEEKEYI